MGRHLGGMLPCVCICCVGGNPTVNEVSYLLCRIKAVFGIVKELSIFSGPERGNLVRTNSFVRELRQELRHERNCCHVSCRDQVDFTSMSQLAKRKVVSC